MLPKIVIAGGNGFLGTVLARHFQARNYSVCLLCRDSRKATARVIRWDGRTLGPWVAELESAYALINLAGRSVNCRYTRRNRREIMESRIGSTRVLGRAIAGCGNPPRIWLNSSTATIYKHTLGPAWLESGEIGATVEAKDAFSIEVATAWENEFFAAELPHVRRAALRSAIVFGDYRGTIFSILRTLAKLALAGRMGDGRQWVSWIHAADFARAVEFILGQESLSGPINVAAPNPISNGTMMRTFREAAGVPWGVPAPRWLLEIAAFVHRTETELLIKSRHVVPGKLNAAGFQFLHPQFAEAIADLSAMLEVPQASAKWLN